jgi:hypothetical protein
MGFRAFCPGPRFLCEVLGLYPGDFGPRGPSLSPRKPAGLNLRRYEVCLNVYYKHMVPRIEAGSTS